MVGDQRITFHIAAKTEIKIDGRKAQVGESGAHLVFITITYFSDKTREQASACFYRVCFLFLLCNAWDNILSANLHCILRIENESYLLLLPFSLSLFLFLLCTLSHR